MLLALLLFNLFILILLFLDLGVFHKKSHAISYKESLFWSFIWVTLALLFGAGVFLILGRQAGFEYLTGYLIEKTLSIDNIFVLALVFQTMGIPPLYHHRILYLGIIGAIILRAIMIFFGVLLIQEFHWIFYVFGVFLIVTAGKMLFSPDVETNPKDSRIYRFIQKLILSTSHLHGQKFFVRRLTALEKLDPVKDEALFMKLATLKKNVWVATPLFLTLILVESSDLIFAMDSIPAIFAITLDPFIVYTSNIFAILGLRSLYFLLAGALYQFSYLKYGLSMVLFFVGVKMLISGFYKIDTLLSLGIVVLLLGMSVIISLRRSQCETKL